MEIARTTYIFVNPNGNYKQMSGNGILKLKFRQTFIVFISLCSINSIFDIYFACVWKETGGNHSLVSVAER